MKQLLFLILFIASFNSAFADTLTLSSGSSVEGKIVEQTAQYVKFDNGAGATITYYMDEVKAINGQSIEVKPPAPIATTPVEPIQQTVDVAAPVPAVVTNEPPVESSAIPTPSEAVSVPQAVPVDVPSVNNLPQVDETGNRPITLTNSDLPAQIQGSTNRGVLSDRTRSHSMVKNVDPKALLTIFGIFMLFMIVVYIVSVMPLVLLSRKLNIGTPWLGWVPIANLYLMCQLAGKPGWWFLLCLVPLVNIIIVIIVWMEISKNCGKPAWLGILVLIPIVGTILPWYLALDKQGA